MNESSGPLNLILPATGFFVLVAAPSGGFGVLLILLALALFAADLHLGITGVLALAGVAALIAGVFILIAAAGLHLGLPLWLLAGIAALLGLACVAWVRSFWRSHRRVAVVGEHTMVGRTAKVVTTLDPAGYVVIGGENWRARLVAGRANPGELVSVTAVHGLELEVQRIGKGISGQQSSPFTGRQGREV